MKRERGEIGEKGERENVRGRSRGEDVEDIRLSIILPL